MVDEEPARFELGEGCAVSIRIGYKASAEQFGPRDLVEFAVRAEEHGLGVHSLVSRTQRGA